MVKGITLLILALLFLLTACRGQLVEEENEPTPFPVQIPVQRITTAAPIPISLENLAANPDFYIGATLQLSGQFHRLPRLVCEGNTYPSPATWGLEENGFLANAAGMNTQMRSLVDEGQVITIEGRWLKYEGPIGCEGHVENQTIWYLSTDRVLDPYPLVRLQTTQVAEGTAQEQVSEVAEVTTESVDQSLLTATTLPETITTAVPTFTPTIAEVTPIITSTVTFTPLPPITSTVGSTTPTISVNQTPLGTPNGSPTATADGSGAQATGTVTVTPAASATPSNAIIVEKDSLEAEDLIISNLGSANIDEWTLDLVAGDAITITVAPATTADILLSVFDSSNVALVNQQNLSAAGMPETITNLNISESGIHNIQIQTSDETQTDYALMFMDSDSYSFIFKGRLTPNSAKNGIVEADTDHFWFFNAENSDTVSFVVTPNDNGDPYIELYDPEGSRIYTLDDTGQGEAESLNNYTLLDGGMYGIRVAEFDFQPMSYSIELLP